MTLSDRARTRLIEVRKQRNIGQQELADMITHQTGELWTQSRVGKLLSGAVELRLDDADAMAHALGLPMTEVIRDRGMEFYADLTPTQLRIVEYCRQSPELAQHVLAVFSHVEALLRAKQKRTKARRIGRPMESEKARKAGSGVRS